MSIVWQPPTGPYVDAEIYSSGDTNIRQSNFQCLQQAFGLFGNAGARYVSPNTVYPDAKDAAQWLIQTRGFYTYTAGMDTTTYIGLPTTSIPFTVPFPIGGGVSFIRAKMRYAYNGSGGLTYGMNHQVAVLDDSITLFSFAVVTFDLAADKVVTTGSYSLSYMAVGYTPQL